MLANVTCQTPRCLIRLAWLSFQPDGSVSVGLRDRSFIVKRFKARNFVWSAYNRVRVQYAIQPDFDALEAVNNPHFTFHPPVYFHLKSNDDRSGLDEDLFACICEPSLVLLQQKTMPWLRVKTQPLQRFEKSELRASNNIQNVDLNVNALDESVSLGIEVDFIRVVDIPANTGPWMWAFQSGNIGIAIRVFLTFPAVPTLSWFHEY